MKQSSISKFIYEQYEIPDFLYENKNPLNKRIIRAGFLGLKNSKFARDLFIKQAMGRVKLI